MASILYVATEQGLLTAEERDGDWHESSRSLRGLHVTTVIAREGIILAGTTEGIFRSDDLGGAWTPANSGLTHPHLRWMAYHPDISDLEFAGTEPAAIFVSRDGAV